MSTHSSTGAGAESNDSSRTEYFFNTKTRTIETGPISDWSNRLGPYASRDEAAAALDSAAARNQSWEDDDKAWED